MRSSNRDNKQQYMHVRKNIKVYRFDVRSVKTLKIKKYYSKYPLPPPQWYVQWQIEHPKINECVKFDIYN